MAIKIVYGYADPDFDTYKDIFKQFNALDWEHMIIGDNQNDVHLMADILKSNDFEIKKLGDQWIALTYC